MAKWSPYGMSTILVAIVTVRITS